MARIYLAFDTTTEKEDYEMALNGSRYKWQLEEMDTWLRNIIKYDDGDNGRARLKVMQEVRNKLIEIMNEE